ncbi:MAG: hypothetical protein AB4352_09080 [Hormoscilla sp.]
MELPTNGDPNGEGATLLLRKYICRGEAGGATNYDRKRQILSPNANCCAAAALAPVHLNVP